jgi:hypothetical protein
MKVAQIAVPDCYGTLDRRNKHCTSSECTPYDYCMDETENLKETRRHKEAPKE